MEFFSLSFWQGFFGNLFATLIGAIVGIPIALWINKRTEQKIAKEKQNKILATLYEEINDNLQILRKLSSIENSSGLTEELMYSSYLVTEMWDAFSDGGELQWFTDVYLLSRLAEAYGDIKRIKDLYEKFLNFRSITDKPSGTIFKNMIALSKLAVSRLASILDIVGKDQNVLSVRYANRT